MSTVWISESVLDDLTEAALSAHPVETGGILIGVRTDGRPWVTDAPVILCPQATSTSYQVGVGARPRLVDAKRSSDPRLGYLGEWHSHTADAGPSSTDGGAMQGIAADSEAACPSPLLVVVRRKNGTYRVDAHEWSEGRLDALDITLAGNLPRRRRRFP